MGIKQSVIEDVIEIETPEYSLLLSDELDAIWCTECNQEKEGVHMLHSIYFEDYTDVAPMCLDCVKHHQKTYGEVK